MLIVYASKTGNVERFVKQTGFPSLKIEEGLVVDEPFVLVTYTRGFGQVPVEVDRFILRNSRKMVGVASSGNLNWGVELFARSGDILSKRYEVPLLMKFELSGTGKDVRTFVERVSEIETHRAE